MPNQLAGETSPYLLQHADNPVDWQPWGEAALARARREDRPVLLSIGYSACHWCHVMAHESFADPETAAVMNRLFVNIKVDREERPDLDQIYQAAHQLLARRAGGWPLTMFLTPAGLPFYGGTYFPPRARHGLPAFGDLLERVADAWRRQRDEIAAQGDSLVAALAAWSAAQPALAGELDRSPIAAAVAELARNYDTEHGGFGTAPKFPRPGDLALLLRHSRCSGDVAAREMALATLRQIAEGGIRDQLAGGFCRYSVDSRWDIPHFEKMLYDNALLLGVYVDAWRIAREPLFAQVVESTVGWLAGEMRAPSGAFHSALDADSEGDEGRFYLWQRDEVAALLDEPQRTLVLRHYGLLGRPNFAGEAWNLRVVEALASAATAAGIAPEAAPAALAAARGTLLQARAKRVRPACDDKCLTAWNALAIAALARAARVFDRADWLALARGAVDFIVATHWRDGRLLASSRNGQAHLNAYLDDYAYLLDALVEMLQADFRAADLDLAMLLADALLANFVDPGRGDFVFTSHDHETLIHRPRAVYDNATPAGSAVAVLALLRLARICAREDWATAAERALRAQLAAVGESPAGAATLLCALDELLGGGRLLVIGGPAERTGEWQRKLARVFAPETLIVVVPASGKVPPPLTAALSWTGAQAAGWSCADGVCQVPETALEKLVAALHTGGKGV